MKQKFDVVIIGGGPGGLSIGSLLAREGISSAIIEKEQNLGGRYRAVEFQGCRSDNGVRMPTGLVRTPEETHMHKFLSHMGIEVETKVVNWTMGKVSRENPDRIEYFTMDVGKGIDNFFDFFSFGSGMQMEEPTKQSMMKAFRIMEDTSEEECRKLVSISFADWMDKNIDDPIARIVLELAAPLMGAPANVVNYGAFANVMGTFPRVGALLFWYPRRGNMEDMVVAPLTKYYSENGGTIVTNTRARSIEVENGRAKGVVVQNNETRFVEEYEGRAVICAIPIFEAIGRNVVAAEHLTREWAQAIELCSRLSYEDLTVFYLLRQDVFPRDGYGWVHIFDADYGIPTYVGDWCVGSLYNAIEPAGKQLIYSYIPGGLPDTHFGLTSPMPVVKEAVRRWEEAVGKVYPQFLESVEHKVMSLQLNWGRYSWAAVPTEIDIASPNIKGLFFAGDTIRSVTSMVSDKIFQMAFPLRESVLEYLRATSNPLLIG